MSATLAPTDLIAGSGGFEVDANQAAVDGTEFDPVAVTDSAGSTLGGGAVDGRVLPT